MFRELLQRFDVAVREMAPEKADPDALFDEERQLVEKAVHSRRQEFAAGRLLAREALASLGAPAGPLLRDGERVPCWPTGFVGSISHTRTWAAAAVALGDAYLGVGIDVERDMPLKERVLEAIATEDDRMSLRQLGLDPLYWGKLIFSAKEAAYKAQYAVTSTYLGFDAMWIEVHPERGQWTAHFRAEVGPFRRGHTLLGDFSWGGGLVATALVLRREDLLRLPRQGR